MQSVQKLLPIVVNLPRRLVGSFPLFVSHARNVNRSKLWSNRTLLYSTLHHGVDGVISELDTDYIVPYQKQDESFISVNNMKKLLKDSLDLSYGEIEQIVNNAGVQNIKDGTLISTVEMLIKAGIRKECFIDFPWIITLQRPQLKDKLVLLCTLNGLKDVNDFISYLRLPFLRLRKIIRNLNNEKKYASYGNRAYYFSEKLALHPYIVNKHLAKRLFVLEMPCDMFEKNLELMLKYKIDSMSILKDLWVFLYAPSIVETRLKRAKLGKKDKIKPWMIKCREPTLKRCLQLTQEKLEVLGDKQTAEEYIAERLQITVEEARAVMKRYGQVRSVRVTKIKEVFDYLLDEAGFSTLEIAQVPRILCSSLKTTKKRLEEIKKLGCHSHSLMVVCRSKLQYQAWIERWKKMNQIKETQK
uniref:Transcription termination factor, mitochondrial n=1 Tax=Glossina brevipalpis TaxID=37001 RepID=A0A1A9VZM1_9MUSC